MEPNERSLDHSTRGMVGSSGCDEAREMRREEPAVDRIGFMLGPPKAEKVAT